MKGYIVLLINYIWLDWDLLSSNKNLILQQWKKKNNDEEQEAYKKNNFVVLSADYKNMLLNKIQLTNEK